MNGIKDWVKKASEDKNFAKKFEGKSAKEVSALAKKEGFSFTPEEFMDLKMEVAAGGGTKEDIMGWINTGLGVVKTGADIYNSVRGKNSNNNNSGNGSTPSAPPSSTPPGMSPASQLPDGNYQMYQGVLYAWKDGQWVKYNQ